MVTSTQLRFKLQSDSRESTVGVRRSRGDEKERNLSIRSRTSYISNCDHKLDHAFREFWKSGQERAASDQIGSGFQILQGLLREESSLIEVREINETPRR